MRFPAFLVRGVPASRWAGKGWAFSKLMLGVVALCRSCGVHRFHYRAVSFVVSKCLQSPCLVSTSLCFGIEAEKRPQIPRKGRRCAKTAYLYQKGDNIDAGQDSCHKSLLKLNAPPFVETNIWIRKSHWREHMSTLTARVTRLCEPVTGLKTVSAEGQPFPAEYCTEFQPFSAACSHACHL